MATVADYFNTANRMELVNSDTMAVLNELNAAMLATRPQVINLISQVPESLSKIAVMACEFQSKNEKLLKLMTPSLLKAAEMSTWFSSLIQPYLDLINSIAPTMEQISTLLQQTSTFVQDVGPISEEDVSKLSSEEWEETNQVVEDILTEPKNWEQTLDQKLSVVKTQHPILSKVIPWALNMILTCYIGAAASAAGSADATKPKEQPAIDAPAITDTVPDQRALVIDAVPGYYKIKLRNPETGETEIGWVAERFFQQQDEAATDTAIRQE